MDNTEMFSPLQKGAISEIIVQRITDAIIKGELKPGDKIPTELEFCQRLNVGRNTVREAVKVLVSFGVLEIRRSEGTFVVKDFSQKMLDPMVYGMIMSRSTLDDLLEFEISMLRGTMLLAIEKATDADMAKARQAYLHLEDVNAKSSEADISLQYDAITDYYKSLGRLCSNSVLTYLYDMVLDISKYTRIRSLQNFWQTNRGGSKKPDLTHFRLLLEALEARDISLINLALDATMKKWESLKPEQG